MELWKSPVGINLKPRALLIGSQSQVCQGWVERSSVLGSFELFHISRSQSSLPSHRSEWLGELDSRAHSGFDFSLVVNFIGASNPSQIAGMPLELADAMRHSDEIGLHHARRGAHYVFLSTGAVHDVLPSRGGPVTSSLSSSMYVQEKKRAEIAHATSGVRESCADLRIFGFVSDPRDAEIATLIGSLWRAFTTDKRFVTNSAELKRDFWGSDEASLALDSIVRNRGVGPFDAFSASPASKTEIAEFLGLEVVIDDSQFDSSSPTGSKSNYFSLDRGLTELGFSPIRRTQEIIFEAFANIPR